jgi:hypothetical protein
MADATGRIAPMMARMCSKDMMYSNG